MSDLGRLSEWEPHTKKVEAGDISAPTLSSYKAERQFATFRVTSKMQVAALKQDQKVVFTESSDFHSATHQYSFLKDPNNDSITLVRCERAFSPLSLQC